MADLELVVATLRMALDAVADCLEALEEEDVKLAYTEATTMAEEMNERVRQLRYKLRA